MAYNNIVSRENTKVLQPEQRIVDDILKGVVTGSTILPLATRLPNMTTKTAKLPILNSLPSAYWVAGDTGIKQTTEAAWKGKFLVAEELAVVVPISDAVFEDANYDIWGEIKPRIIEALYKKIDEAIILGKDRPSGFREGLIPSVINAGSNVTYSSSDSLYTQISKAMGKVEEDGYDVNGILGGLGFKAEVRTGFVDANGQPLNASEVTEMPRYYAKNGAWDNAITKFITGDFKQVVYAIRRDIEFKLFDSGVINDNSGNIIYNLLQQDMKALRVTMRLGWELPNPVNIANTDETSRIPFAWVEPSSSKTTYSITFTVTDTQGTPAPVADAFIDMQGQILKTNASGQAVFKSYGNTTYNYTVTKGSKTVDGTVTVATSNTTVSVTKF